MSIHPSLSISDKDKKARSVMKRTERIRSMMEKGQWKEGDDVYKLPKIKAIRIRIKKEKAEKTTEAAATAEGAAPAGAAAPAAKEAAQPKGGAKAQDKK
jgi:small basic protein (TIGR04137 family)